MIIDIIIIRNEFFKERQKKFVCYYDYLLILTGKYGLLKFSLQFVFGGDDKFMRLLRE